MPYKVVLNFTSVDMKPCYSAIQMKTFKQYFHAPHGTVHYAVRGGFDFQLYG